jgi:hypothetical protein
MKIFKLIRDTFTDTTTIGKLYVDGVYFCEILEDKDRGLHQMFTLEHNKRLKQAKVTAIPYGKYKGIVNLSPGKKRVLPRILGVEGYDGILIHKGNKAEDTEGCLITGTTRGNDEVYQSTAKEEELLKLIPEGAEFEIEITCAEKYTDKRTCI